MLFGLGRRHSACVDVASIDDVKTEHGDSAFESSYDYYYHH